MPGIEKDYFATGELFLMGAPQIIMLGLFAMNLYEAWNYERQEGEAGEFVAELISVTLWIALLFWGGFFH